MSNYLVLGTDTSFLELSIKPFILILTFLFTPKQIYILLVGLHTFMNFAENTFIITQENISKFTCGKRVAKSNDSRKYLQSWKSLANVNKINLRVFSFGFLDKLLFHYQHIGDIIRE